MQVPVVNLRRNPLRRFDLHPIDEHQVDVLMRSISDRGFFGSIEVRPSPSEPNIFEIAYGHNRMEAIVRLGLTTVECTVKTYTDQQLASVAAAENFISSRKDLRAALDHVAQFVYLISHAVLLGDPRDDSFLSSLERADTTARVRETILRDGPGWRLLYRAINGFHHAQRKEMKEAETITEYELVKAITSLRDDGIMANIVAIAVAEANQMLEEKSAATMRSAQAAAAQAAVQAAAEEALRQAEIERKEKEAKEAAANLSKEEARRKQQEIDRLNKAAEKERERAAKEAEKAAATVAKQAKAEADQREKAEKAAEAQRQRAEKDKETKAAKAAADALKEAEARARLGEIYDFVCDKIFPTAEHSEAFRKAITTIDGQRFVPRNMQLQLAQQINTQIRSYSKKIGDAVEVMRLVHAYLTDARSAQKKNDDEEVAERLRTDAVARVEKLWTQMRISCSKTDEILAQLMDEQRNWKYDTALFPMPLDQIQNLILFARGIRRLEEFHPAFSSQPNGGTQKWLEELKSNGNVS